MKNEIKIDAMDKTQVDNSLKSLSASLEQYKKISSSLTTSMNEMMKVYSKINIDGILEPLRNTLNSYTRLNMSCLTNGLYSDSFKKSIEALAQIFKVYENLNVSELAKKMEESMNAISRSFALQRMEQLQQIDFSAMFADVVPKASSLSEIVSTSYTLVQEELESKKEEKMLFTEEEIHEALSEQVTDPKGFQARVARWTESKKIQFFIIWNLILFICGNFVQPYFQEYVGIPVMTYVVSNVKELPEKGAKIIGQLQENIEAIITEDVNYYYKVTFTDENGEIQEGYVAKRNLRIIKKECEEAQTITEK